MSPLLDHLRRHPAAVEADVLLAAAGQCDCGAFADFYDRTAPMTFGLLRRGLGEQADAALAMERLHAAVAYRTAFRARP